MTDGLAGLGEAGITDVAICGMGGELIARILSDAPFLKKEETRLILQPMTRPAAVRSYLAENGFVIDEERLCTAAGKAQINIFHWKQLPKANGYTKCM